MQDLIDELSEADKGVVVIELDHSAITGLKKMPVDMFDNVYLGENHNTALILCVDVRNFSDFLCSQPEETVFELIREFTSNLLSCVSQFGIRCSYYKLMGDGAIVIWDETNEVTINEAITVFDTYTDFLDEELFKNYKDLGMGGALVMDQVFKYEMSAEVSQLKYRDYVGYGINLACRLQGLANKDELVINEALAKTGAIPVRAVETEELMKELHILKGLKEDDRKRVLFYDNN